MCRIWKEEKEAGTLKLQGGATGGGGRSDQRRQERDGGATGGGRRDVRRRQERDGGAAAGGGRDVRRRHGRDGGAAANEEGQPSAVKRRP
ncbi:unnamed protein product [Linum trigynum]|uniref:Uncharacterized protein n=1 Tax=Linum trigynum TaxID=586398 RepID=A0AAV2GN12_9ROSI